jgi:LacI family transcriptional regulator
VKPTALFISSREIACKDRAMANNPRSTHSQLPKLRDVAAAAGVSLSVASRVLSGKADAYRISESASRRVRKEAERLGFQPDRSAKALRLGKSRMIGVVVPDIANTFFASIAQQVAFAAERVGYDVLLADSSNSSVREASLIAQLLSRQIEGLVVCPVGGSFDHLNDRSLQKFPLVLVDRVTEISHAHVVTSDHRLGGMMLAEHLLMAGHRRIGVLQGLPGTWTNEKRLEGIRAALRKSRLKEDTLSICGSDFTIESGASACRQLLRDQPNVSAIIALGNPQALGCLEVFQEKGLGIPQDLSLVSFDDHPFVSHLASPLTVIQQDVCMLGREASRLLFFDLLGNVATKKSEVIVPVKLEVRKSVKVLSRLQQRERVVS